MDILDEAMAAAKSRFPLQRARNMDESNELVIRQSSFIEGAIWAIRGGYTLPLVAGQKD